MLECMCGKEYPDYESWMQHVKRGIKIPRYSLYTSQETKEQDQYALGAYLEKHILVENSFNRKAAL